MTAGKNDISITRRCFNGGVALSVAVLGAPLLLAAENHAAREADGLIQIKRNGKIHIYSGAGHFGLYGYPDYIHQLASVLHCGVDEIIVESGRNLMHLPAILGQHINHLSFTDIKTNLNAARLLRNEISARISLPESAYYVFEQGISQKTIETAKSLDPEGIIVAARQA